jgi:hypothetical protein
LRRFLFENGLSVFFGVIFIATLAGQSLAGQRSYNAEQLEHGSQPVSWLDYVLSPSFGGAVLENWQSEFLQFSLFVLATVWLVQKGSNESKKLEDVGIESKNSLLIVMTLIFLACWLGQSLNNWREFNANQLEHDEATVSWGRYLLDPDFWERTLQNWQSEFLAVGTMAVFTIYLRQRGSPESKPVGAPHEETASSG